MSPEQAAGKLAELGPASDVYSLGATLYCLLTGRAPFSETDVGTVLRQVQTGDFPPPRQVNRSVAPALEAICLKAMALDAANRYTTPKLLADEIERWLADEPVMAYREPPAVRARRWMWRHRTAVTTAAAAVLVALVRAAAVLAVQTKANADLRAANRDLAAANKLVTQANIDLFAANERETARFNLAMDAVKLFHGEVSKDLLLKEKPFEGLRASLLRGAAGFYSKLEELLAGHSDRQSRVALGKAYDELGELSDQIGSKAGALAVHRKALAVRRELADDAEAEADLATKADVVSSLLAIGRLQEATGDQPGALASFEDARRLAEGLAASLAAAEPLQALVARCHRWIGVLLADTGKPVEGLEEMERAGAIQQKLADANPEVTEFQRDLAGSYNSIGYQLHQMGKPAAAQASYQRAIAIRQKLDDDNPNDTQSQFDLSSSYHNIGYLFYATGRPAEAVASYERALALRQKVADANPNVSAFQYKMAGTQVAIGQVLQQIGKPGEALVAYERAIKIDQKLTRLRLRPTRCKRDGSGRG
jgi:tetratricopeptide (TPR) repeat protein